MSARVRRATDLLKEPVEIHVRTRLTADFTVISHALAQRRGSAVTVGVAAYIASLPDGSPVCDGCDRGFRTAEPGRCRDCRARDPLRAAG